MTDQLPIARVVVVGKIAAPPERKQINNSDLAEFRIEGVGLKITAWKDLAASVPASGYVIIEGRLNTRAYEYEGKSRQEISIVASSVVQVGGNRAQPVAPPPPPVDTSDLGF